MNWFEGSIPEAIQETRANSAILVVFIDSKDAKGTKMRDLWKNVDSAAAFGEVHYVAIRLEAGGQHAQQFAQIYPTPILPASYFIDLRGHPLEIITLITDVGPDQFTTSIRRACSAFARQTEAAVPLPSPSHSAPLPSASSAPMSPPAPVSSSGDAASPSTTATAADLGIEEKIKRAKELLEKKRREEAAQKEQEERQKELERRDAAKALLRRQQELRDKEQIEAAEERRREKARAEKEKERVLEQIKADREDREARARRGAAANAATVPEQDSATVIPSPVSSDSCRIQFKFPDGSLFVQEFASSDLLNSLKEIVRQDPRVGGGAFRIAQAAPRRVFSEEEGEQSLLALSLTPASSLLVILESKAAGAVGNVQALVGPSGIFGGFSHLFTLLVLSPLQYLLAFLGIGGGGRKEKDGSQKKKKITAVTAGSSQERGISAAAGEEEGARRRRGLPRPAEVRQSGNIRTLHNDEHSEGGAGSDGEEGNWNGNSTQFF